MNELWLHFAITRYWNEVPADRDIPYIGLSDIAKTKVKSYAIAFQLQYERENLQKILTYAAVSGR